MAIGKVWINGYDLLAISVWPMILAAVIASIIVCLDRRLSLPMVVVDSLAITAVLLCSIALVSYCFALRGLI